MTEKLTLKERAVRGYWSIVGVAGALIFSLQPVLADDIWSRFSTIMKDVYGELVGIFVDEEADDVVADESGPSGDKYITLHCLSDCSGIRRANRSNRGRRGRMSF